MKLKKRLIALVCVLMMLLSLAACGGEPTPPPDPLATAMENLKTVENLQAEAKMDMTMTVNGETVDTKTSMDIRYFFEPLHMMIGMDMSAAGENMAMNMYYEQREDGIEIYVEDAENWYYGGKIAMEDADTLEAYGYNPEELMGDYTYTADGTEEVDGVTLYKYTCELTGEAMQEAMNSSGAMSSMGDTGMSEEDMEEMLKSLDGTSIKVSVWISEANMLPVRYEMDMTEVMNALMTKIVEVSVQSAGVSADELGIEMSVSKVVATVRFFNYNNAEDFEVPADIVEYFKSEE